MGAKSSAATCEDVEWFLTPFFEKNSILKRKSKKVLICENISQFYFIIFVIIILFFFFFAKLIFSFLISFNHLWWRLLSQILVHESLLLIGREPRKGRSSYYIGYRNSSIPFKDQGKNKRVHQSFTIIVTLRPHYIPKKKRKIILKRSLDLPLFLMEEQDLTNSNDVYATQTRQTFPFDAESF